MALYAIGDLHLSLAVNKSMEVFGGGWANYVERIQQAFSQLGPDDVTVLCGDTSWGISLEEAAEDFRLIDSFPGKKLLLKGNHDYWWNTASKMKSFFEREGITSLEILHNNCFFYGDYALCGTRGWFFEEDQKAQDAKVLNREVGRLETSLQAAGDRKKLCFLHYPPLYQGYQCPEILKTLQEYQVAECYYGHLHGASHRLAIQGSRFGTDFFLVAADYLGFIPKKICD
ncbi:metallophosphoesterase [Oscillibacter hominis]|uniref:Metallophosphoesterase n=1 Tax=Oscillibacter hominis TaxID=2763056 RepID=A0A7G9B810_9FIRM|nr:metallophosphoesterase [Oscillibacter hominis]QNL45691.1 metallophosphoesterase [Oscillibacter hominis]